MSDIEPELSIEKRVVTSIGAKVGGKIKISGTGKVDGEYFIAKFDDGKSILEKVNDVDLVTNVPLKPTKPYFRQNERY